MEVVVDIEASELAICEEASITFTATSSNAGNDPVYQWQINGMPVGTNDAEFTTNLLQDNDLVNCILTSSETCTTGNVVNSSSLMINVYPNLAVEVSIFASSLSSCEGEEISFMAEALNPGDDPIYQWFVNGVNTQNTGIEWTTDALVQGDEVTCILTSSALCTQNNDPISNALELTVEPIVDLVVEIESSSIEACIGEDISFTALVENGGSDPVFEWRVNGEIMNETTAVFTTNTLLNGDVVDCTVNASHPCLTANSIASNPVQMISCTTPIFTLDKPSEILLFPNPAQDEFQLQISDLSGTASLTIFDVSGKIQQVERLTFNGLGHAKTIKCEQLVAGIYIVMLRHKDIIYTNRIVIKP